MYTLEEIRDGLGLYTSGDVTKIVECNVQGERRFTTCQKNDAIRNDQTVWGYGWKSDGKITINEC